MKLPIDRLFRARFAMLAFGIYIGIYATLSLCGKYEGNVSSLKTLGIYCSCMSDHVEWQPALITVTHGMLDGPGGTGHLCASALGYCFLPLVLVDQFCFHPTKPFSYGR
jgi:hypothetical protein